MVGGAVRDILINRSPKDFDVVTNATPEQISAIFNNCRLIGRRFRLAHICFGRYIIEVATYRGSHDSSEDPAKGITTDCGRILRDNVYGSIAEDAIRRDFTVNALFYNVADFSIVDYVGGVADLEEKSLRLIGDPETRYREDPVRMLRAVRFAVKLGFDIEKNTKNPIRKLKDLLVNIPAARLFDECLKLFLGGHAAETYNYLTEFGIDQTLFPQTVKSIALSEDGCSQRMLQLALQNTDTRIKNGMHVTPAFLFAVFLWEPVKLLQKRYKERGESDYHAMNIAIENVVSTQVKRVSMPKRFSMPMKEIWRLQARFKNRGGQRAFKLLVHPRFRAAYDFLLLRAESGEISTELLDWWTLFQEKDEQGRRQMVKSLSSSKIKKKVAANLS